MRSIDGAETTGIVARFRGSGQLGRRAREARRRAYPFNLALMAVPMCLFYEIGILLARLVGRRKVEGSEAMARSE